MGTKLCFYTFDTLDNALSPAPIPATTVAVDTAPKSRWNEDILDPRQGADCDSLSRTSKMACSPQIRIRLFHLPRLGPATDFALLERDKDLLVCGLQLHLVHKK